ncbi:MAG: tetratricopeptide repeat protein [Bacteroidales bacterium]|nr:tetratricopeptide repeat protein [Bacteroidales bacterium]
MKRLTLVILVMILVLPVMVQAQERRNLRQGNKLYQDEKFNDAEIRYRQSLEENPQNIKGMFNLGNALYRQGRFDEAAEIFGGLSQFAPGEREKAFAYHNLGNTHIQSQKYAESVDAYKNALRINPDDEQTRHNLAYAMRLLQEQPPQDPEGEGDDDQDQEQEQNKNKNQDQDQSEDQQQQPQQQPRPDQISPQDAERILDALNQKEQNVQEDLKRDQTQRAPVRQEREW